MWLKSGKSRDDSEYVSWKRSRGASRVDRRRQETCGTGVLLVQAPSGPGALLVPQAGTGFSQESAMTVVRRVRKGGFTLVEILIVVIILGILAAIVIPQFTSASQDARKNSLTSQLQTLRSQIELYKLQHLDNPPPGLSGTAGTTGPGVAWLQLISKTDASSATGTSTAFPFGPYLQSNPANPLNGDSAVFLMNGADPTAGGASGATTADGFVYNQATGKIWGTSGGTGSKIYNESNANDPANDD
jgi:general secretion pathway protein G